MYLVYALAWIKREGVVSAGFYFFDPEHEPQSGSDTPLVPSGWQRAYGTRLDPSVLRGAPP